MATLVAGVESSTQSCKVVVCDADTGTVVREGRAQHPDGTEVHPSAWWEALEGATAAGLLDGVEAISVGAQQHGLVALDAAGEVVRPALLWNDTRSAAAAIALVEQLGGRAAWAEATGSVPVAAFTVTKWRWLCDEEPAHADAVSRLCLPHDWLTWRLVGDPDAPVTTDRGDASGTGWWGPGGPRPDLVALAGHGRSPEVASTLGPAAAAGTTRTGVTVGSGTGDNMAAALGLGLEPGDVVVSLGTSGTVFAVSDEPTGDVLGEVAGFADATGRWLPLVCTLNCARVLDAMAALVGGDLDRRALSAPPGAGGLVLLPYLDGERTPDRPDATGTLAGITRSNLTPEHLARAAVEGVLCGLADGIDALRRVGVRPERVLLIGGAAASEAVRLMAPSVLGVAVVAPPPGEWVALGAARQAAWVLAGTDSPPRWPRHGEFDLGPPAPWGTDVRAAFATHRARSI
ncbi:xylulokinase [soil metagenome]